MSTKNKIIPGICFIILLFPKFTFAQWTLLNSGTTKTLNTMYFINKDTGFVGGEADIINTTLLKTTDGGNNWMPVNIPTLNSIRSIYFPNAQNGFLSVDSFSCSYKTIDDGNTWTYFNPVICCETDFYFTNVDTGFSFSWTNGRIAYTFDGGLTWNEYSQGTFTYGIINIHFPQKNINIGYAVTAMQGLIYKTTDNGVSWNQIANPTSQNLYDIYFTSLDTGYVLGSNFILKTINGGINWGILNSTIGGNKIQFINSSTCYVLNSNGVIISNDGGITFNTMSGVQYGLSDFQIFSATVGYCIGSNGRIYKLNSISSISELEDYSENFIQLFPNPVDDILNINSQMKLKSVLIFDTEERIVLSLSNINKNDLRIKLNLASGIYMIEVSSENRISRQKFIKQ